MYSPSSEEDLEIDESDQDTVDERSGNDVTTIFVNIFDLFIPSSSLVLTVIICQAVDVPITGMYAVVVAIDWFINRFRIMLNICSDLFAVGIITKMSSIQRRHLRDPRRRGSCSGQGAPGARRDLKV